MTRQYFFRFAVASELTLLLSGCSNQTEDLKQWMQTQAESVRGKVAPIPEIQINETFHFDPKTINDPFKNPFPVALKETPKALVVEAKISDIKKILPPPSVSEITGATTNAPSNTSARASGNPSESTAAPNESRTKEVLEGFSLEKMRMVGTIRAANQTELTALVRTEDGRIFQTLRGKYLGHNHGVITSISETEISINEYVQNRTGAWSQRQVQLKLAEANLSDISKK